jgi:hypothetical protein
MIKKIILVIPLLLMIFPIISCGGSGTGDGLFAQTIKENENTVDDTTTTETTTTNTTTTDTTTDTSTTDTTSTETTTTDTTTDTITVIDTKTTTTTTAFSLPDTGQTISYTTTFGEDADYSINPPSYSDNGDGTVTDNVTGLMWQQEDDDTTYNWYEATGKYDATDNLFSTHVCDSLSLAGHSDWRLPDEKELLSIVNYDSSNPAIDTIYFPNTNSSGYWTSTTCANSTSRAWGVDFDIGGVFDINKTDYCGVRCVRGEQ